MPTDWKSPTLNHVFLLLCYRLLKFICDLLRTKTTYSTDAGKVADKLVKYANLADSNIFSPKTLEEIETCLLV